jgi:hypothetical protein
MSHVVNQSGRSRIRKRGKFVFCPAGKTRVSHKIIRHVLMFRSSREYGLMPLQSTANASWEKPLSSCLSPNELSTSSTKPSICVDRLLLHLRRDRRQLLAESHKREKRPTPQKRPLVDAVKMDRLLQQLRTNEFIGTIDPKHHSYLSEKLLQESAKQCTVKNELMPRRSFAYVSTKKESSHFKVTVKKAKSTAAARTTRISSAKSA